MTYITNKCIKDYCELMAIDYEKNDPLVLVIFNEDKLNSVFYNKKEE